MSTRPSSNFVSKLYDLLVGNGGERVRKDITDGAAQAVPANFLRLLVTKTATKVGDALSKPGVILTWLLGMLGAPSSLVGLVEPVRQAGSLLPQLAISQAIGRRPIRKYFYAAGSAVQGLAVLGMAVVAPTLEGVVAGWAIVGLLAVFSLARGVCSVTSKDLVGRTIPKTRRGRLGGLAGSISGFGALGVGVWLLSARDQELGPVTFSIILGTAGLLWLVGAAVIATLDEEPAKLSDQAGGLSRLTDSIGLLRRDRNFRLFCISRALLAGTVLSMPFYVILAREATGGRASSLGLLMIAGSLATALSAVVWGTLADRSSRLTLGVAGTSAGLIGVATAFVSRFEVTEPQGLALYTGLFFLIGLAHTGIREGRKTYLIDMATADTRASMVAVSNTLIGGVLLFSASFGLLADWFGERAVILAFAIPGLAGGLLAFRLPEVAQTE